MRRRDRPTMQDVATQAGVSRALVSLVFRGRPGASEQTRERVFRVADELGYRPDTAAEAHGVRQVVDHLVELGHRDIAHLDGGTGSGSAERRRAYRAGMRRHGLADHVRVLPGDHTEAAGLDAARTLLAGDLPTAVFA